MSWLWKARYFRQRLLFLLELSAVFGDCPVFKLGWPVLMNLGILLINWILYQSILPFIGLIPPHNSYKILQSFYIILSPESISIWMLELPTSLLLKNCGRCLDYEQLGILGNFYCFYWNCPLFLAIVRCLNLDNFVFKSDSLIII